MLRAGLFFTTSALRSRSIRASLSLFLPSSAPRKQNSRMSNHAFATPSGYPVNFTSPISNISYLTLSFCPRYSSVCLCVTYFDPFSIPSMLPTSSAIVILPSVSLLYLVSSSMNAVISGLYSFINPFETKFLRPSNFHMPVVFTRRSLNFAAMCLSSRVRNQADFVLVLFPYNQMTFLSLNFFTTKPESSSIIFLFKSPTIRSSK